MPREQVTRAEFLRRAGIGAAGLAVAGGGAYALAHVLDDDAGARMFRPEAGTAHRFVSRPDLRPPKVTVVKNTGRTGHGYLMLTPLSGPGHRGPMIIDDDGNVVWFHDLGRGRTKATNLRSALYHGKPVLTWWEGDVDKQGLGLGEHVVMDSSYREIARFPVARGRGGDLHEFVLTPDGTALVSAWANFSRNLVGSGGRRRHSVIDGIAQEIQVETASLVFEWRAKDHVPLEESYAPVAPRFDFFHINSIDLAPDGDWIISARNMWAVYKVSRKTGQIVWRLGGKRSDFSGDGTKFAWQHDARAHGDGSVLSLFDNGASPKVEPQSRGLLIKLDEGRRQATLRQLFRHRPNRLLAHYMGSTQMLRNGNAMLGWGSEPYLTEFAPDGSIVFDAKLPRAGQTYRAVRMPWVGRPLTKPTLTSRRVNGRTRLYASWNGATELARWHIRTGSRATNLRDAATVPAKGFETAIELHHRPAFAAVTALDSAGRPLASSPAIAL